MFVGEARNHAACSGVGLVGLVFTSVSLAGSAADSCGTVTGGSGGVSPPAGGASAPALAAEVSGSAWPWASCLTFPFRSSDALEAGELAPGLLRRSAGS